MYVDNITSDAMVLNYNGKAMQIKVYEDLLKEKDKEIEKLKDRDMEVLELIDNHIKLYARESDMYSLHILNKIRDILDKEVN